MILLNHFQVLGHDAGICDRDNKQQFNESKWNEHSKQPIRCWQQRWKIKWWHQLWSKHSGTAASATTAGKFCFPQWFLNTNEPVFLTMKNICVEHIELKGYWEFIIIWNMIEVGGKIGFSDQLRHSSTRVPFRYQAIN